MRTEITRIATIAFCLTACLASVAWGGRILAQNPEPAGQEPAADSGSAIESSPAAKYFPDAVLVNQDGQEMRFYSDLLQGKVVVINTIFTTCTGICPVMSKTYARLQDFLGDRLGRDVYLISISVDPENDTPKRLKAFGDAFGAKKGWYLLTGEKANVDLVLHKLGHYVEQKESHTAIMLMGNEPTGLWKKAFGLADSEEIAAILESVLEDKLSAAVTH
jgi:protein SCO1/2